MGPESIHRQRLLGVEMIIAIDSTARGPALGGCRWRPYPDAEAGLADACALARAMTRKSAMAQLQLGGGKAVVIGAPETRTREQLLAFGEFVESLDGRYVTAELSVRIPPSLGAEWVAQIQASPPESVGGRPVDTVTAYPEANLVRIVLEGGVRLQVRPSGTEPKVKLYGEAVDLDRSELDTLLATLATLAPDA